MAQQPDIEATVLEVLEQCVPGFQQRRFVIGFSGGVDSVALLHVMARLARTMPAMSLLAAHVNHNLNARSGHWVELTRKAAHEAGVAYTSLDTGPIDEANGGLEAAARTARYAMLARCLEKDDVLLTAHHLDDQAETVLLQMLRGAGVAGISAMPDASVLAPGLLVRPLLQVPGAALVDHVRRLGLTWIDDPSNLDTRHDRNYLRHRILPTLRTRWPGLSHSLSQVAAACADAQELLDASAHQAMKSVGADPGRLPCALVASLTPAGARNVLRYWLKLQGFTAPPRRRLLAIQETVIGASADASPLVQWPGVQVRRYRGYLHAMAPLDPPPVEPLQLHTAQALKLPGGSSLCLQRRVGSGLAACRLAHASLEVRWRRGGERLTLKGREHSTALKALFQEHGVLPWMRDRVPLLYANDSLVAVADMWADAGFAAAQDEAGLAVIWRNAPRVM